MPEEKSMRPLKNRGTVSERKKKHSQQRADFLDSENRKYGTKRKRTRPQSAKQPKYSSKATQGQKKKRPRPVHDEELINDRKKKIRNNNIQKRKPVASSYSKYNPNSFQDERNRKGYKTLSVVANTFFYLFVFTVVVVGMLTFLSKDNSLFLFGYRPMSIETNSMVSSEKKDGFAAGDLILIQMQKGEKSEVGDIVTFYTDPEKKSTFLTHRIVQKLNDYDGQDGIFFITQGDANNVPDSPISAEAIIGKKVATLPKIGGILLIVKENWKITITFVVILFVILFLVKFLVSYLRKQEGNPKI